MSNVIDLFTRHPIGEAVPFQPCFDIVGDFFDKPRANDLLLVEAVLPRAIEEELRPLLDFLTDSSAEAWAQSLTVVSIFAPRDETPPQPFSLETEFDYQGDADRQPRIFTPAEGVVLVEGYLSRECAAQLAREFTRLGVLPRRRGLKAVS